MGRLSKSALWVLALTAWSSAEAGSIYQAEVVAHPQMQMKEGRVHGCGFQLKAVPKEPSGTQNTVMLDVSLNIYDTGFPMMKGGAVRLALENGTVVTTNAPITGFWLKLEGKTGTAPAGGRVVAAETPGYLLYATNAEDVIHLFYGVLSQKRVSLGVHLKGEPVERIYTGSPAPSEAESKQMDECMSELIAAMKEPDSPK